MPPRCRRSQGWGVLGGGSVPATPRAGQGPGQPRPSEARLPPPMRVGGTLAGGRGAGRSWPASAPSRRWRRRCWGAGRFPVVYAYVFHMYTDACFNCTFFFSRTPFSVAWFCPSPGKIIEGQKGFWWLLFREASSSRASSWKCISRRPAAQEGVTEAEGCQCVAGKWSRQAAHSSLGRAWPATRPSSKDSAKESWAAKESRADHRATRAATPAGRRAGAASREWGRAKAPAAAGLKLEDQPATVGSQQLGIDTLLPRLKRSGAQRSPRAARARPKWRRQPAGQPIRRSSTCLCSR